MIQQLHLLLGIYPKKMKNIQRDTRIPTCTAALFTVAFHLGENLDDL